MKTLGDGFDWMFPILIIIGILGLLIIIGIIGLVFVLGISPYITEKDLSKFCIEQGYDYGDYGQTICQESYCIKQEGTNIIKIEVEGCDESWCFVNKEIKG